MKQADPLGNLLQINPETFGYTPPIRNVLGIDSVWDNRAPTPLLWSTSVVE